MDDKIEYLSKDKYRGYRLPMDYTTEEYFDVSLAMKDNYFKIEMVKKRFKQPVIHREEEYDFPDQLYAEHYPKAEAYGILENEKLLAAIEVVLEEWSNRLRITELYVEANERRRGLATTMMNFVKRKAKEEGRRALILETQSSNVAAISFYLKQGFQLGGFDLSAYHNDDVARHEVRLEFVYFLE